jgi:hypothetical protein
MSSETNSASNLKLSPRPKQDTSSISRLLTLSERDALRRSAQETVAFALKAFAKYSPKTQ